MTENLPAKPDADRALIAEVAMDIGKEAVSHLRIQYPAAFAALGPSGQLSLRNCIHNQIMAALDTTDADEIRARLDRRKASRRKMHKAWDDIRRKPARAPMHQLSPAEHAAMGWSHGQYRDGYCLALMAHDTPKEVAAFKAEAKERGAEYVALFNLPEYLG